MIPSYPGGKFPLSTHLAERVRAMLADHESWCGLPPPVREWLELQSDNSELPDADGVLVETFPRQGKYYIVALSVRGAAGAPDARHAADAAPATSGRAAARVRCQRLRHCALVRARYRRGDIEAGDIELDVLFEEDMLGDDLDAWLLESSLMKRTFRACAVIAGLIERRHPGREKSGRQMTASSDLIYDVLRTARSRATCCSKRRGPIRRQVCLTLPRLGEFSEAESKTESGMLTWKGYHRSPCRYCLKSAVRAFRARRRMT